MKKILFIATSYLIIVSCDSNKKENDTAKTEKDSMLVKTDSVAADLSKNPDMADFVKEVDMNKDGKMSKAEWAAKGLPASSFGMFEKGRGYVLLDDYTKNPAPAGIDGNGDGKLTIAEFVAFDKIMSEKMKNGEMPPPPSK